MDMMSLIDTFFKTDDLKALIHQAGQMLNCPMIAIDDAFQIQASYSPENFQDDVFFAALHRGEITYEAILAISQNEQISQGKSVRMQLQDAAAGYTVSTLFCSVNQQRDPNRVSDLCGLEGYFISGAGK